MRCHGEVVIPPPPNARGEGRSSTSAFDDYVERTVGRVMMRFYLGPGIERGERGAFHDGYVIGGQWTGCKQLARCDPARLQAFHYWLHTQKPTYARHYYDRQRLEPASQEVKVDAKWHEMFPTAGFVHCPYFERASDARLKGMAAALPGDVMRLADVPPRWTCYRVIVGAPSYVPDAGDSDGPVEGVYTIGDEGKFPEGKAPPEIWTHTLAGALELYRVDHADQLTASRSPGPDWLAVTVDYHC